MFKRYLGAVAAAAAILMVWGFVYWTVLPVSFMVVKPFPGDEIASLLADHLGEDGVYAYPWASEAEMGTDPGEGRAELMEKHERGPVMFLFYRSGGVDPSSPLVYVGGFLHFLASASLLGALMILVLPSLATFGRRWLFVFLSGFFAAFAVELSKPIWWHQSWEFHLADFAFVVVGWGLAGAAMAAILKHRPAGAGELLR